MTTTLTKTWARLVHAQPDALALIEAANGRRWTRAELSAHADSWRATLPLEVAGQRVTFALPNGPDWFAAFLGLLLADAIPVPLDPSEPVAAQRTLAASARAPFAWINARLEPIQSNLIGYFGVFQNSPFSTGPSKIQSNLLGYSVPRACLVKLTSGSTGRPRALAFTHAQMLADGRQICAGMGITPDDLNFAVIPLGHSYGLGNLVVPLLAQGTPLVCAGAPLPHALAADIALWKPTVFPAVPALLRALAAADVPAKHLASLRTVISAGSPLTPEIALAFHAKFALKPHGFYGSSETGGITYDRSGDATLAGRSVGAPLKGVTLTPTRAGRFRVTSPAVFHTGSFCPADRATLTDDGELVLLGRTGRMVKIAGRRLDLGELEQSLRRLPDVRDAFVAPHPHHPGELAAVVATPLAASALRPLLRAHLASWKLPRRLVTTAEFPLTARGKPDARALHALLANHR
ncbi:MAG: class I adenylate-forming enzyme family protein [Opitutaceae bacterium]|jgi:acyl-coenzyme A synthetase/AMP-(fatty) acid ligase